MSVISSEELKKFTESIHDLLKPYEDSEPRTKNMLETVIQASVNIILKGE